MNPIPAKEIIGLLQQVIQVLDLPGTDVSWSRYNNVEEVIEDINQHIDRLRRGDLSKMEDLTLLFAPTGSLQDISINNGWGEAFLHLAARFDRATEHL